MTILIFLGALVGCMIIGMPISFALLGAAVGLMLHLDMFDSQIIAQNLINGTTSFTLMAVPFFLLAGEVMNAGGLSKRIVKVALALVGHRKGGLGYVAIVASVLLASLSGSAVADAAALATLLVPMMVASGHNQGQSCGLVAAGGIIGPIIPPSIPFILFGVAGGVSISKLFLAGIVPGILMGMGLAFTWWLVSRHDTAQVHDKQSWADVMAALKEGIWALFLPAIIIFGLKFGIFTPTEAAVVAAAYSLFAGLVIYREIKLKDLFHLFLRASETTAVIMFLVAAAGVSAWLITAADIPAQLAEMVEPFMHNKMLLTFVLMMLVLVVGTALDMTPTILIMTPVLMPVLKQAGIDPVYFGVLFIMNNAIGLVTPPVGTVLNVVCGVARIPMSGAIKGVVPFMIAQTVVMFLLVVFPEIIMLPLKWMTR